MFTNIGIPGLIILLIIALIIFGPSKLPEVGRAFGRTLTEFKSAAKELAIPEKTSEAATHEIQPIANKKHKEQ